MSPTVKKTAESDLPDDLKESVLDLTSCVFCCSDLINSYDDFVSSKFLECCHSVCRDCIAKWEQTEKKQCPECSMEIEKKLLDNFILQEMIDGTAIAKKKITYCGVHTSNATTHWCYGCGDSICEECIKYHSQLKETKSHVIKTKEEHWNDPCIKYMCKIHPKEPLQLFCFTCNVLTCRDCQLFVHRDHTYDFVTDIVDNAKIELYNGNLSLRYFLTILESAIPIMEERKKELSVESEKIQKQINDLAALLISKINKKKHTLLSRVRAMAKSQTEVYDARQNEVKGQMKTVKHCTCFTTNVLRNSSDCSIVQSKAHIMKHIEKLKDLTAVVPNPCTKKIVTFRDNTVDLVPAPRRPGPVQGTVGTVSLKDVTVENFKNIGEQILQNFKKAEISKKPEGIRIKEEPRSYDEPMVTDEGVTAMSKNMEGSVKITPRIVDGSFTMNPKPDVSANVTAKRIVGDGSVTTIRNISDSVVNRNLEVTPNNRNTPEININRIGANVTLSAVRSDEGSNSNERFPSKNIGDGTVIINRAGTASPVVSKLPDKVSLIKNIGDGSVLINSGDVSLNRNSDSVSINRNVGAISVNKSLGNGVTISRSSGEANPPSNPVLNQLLDNPQGKQSPLPSLIEDIFSKTTQETAPPKVNGNIDMSIVKTENTLGEMLTPEQSKTLNQISDEEIFKLLQGDEMPLDFGELNNVNQTATSAPPTTPAYNQPAAPAVQPNPLPPPSNEHMGQIRPVLTSRLIKEEPQPQQDSRFILRNLLETQEYQFLSQNQLRVLQPPPPYEGGNHQIMQMPHAPVPTWYQPAQPILPPQLPPSPYMMYAQNNMSNFNQVQTEANFKCAVCWKPRAAYFCQICKRAYHRTCCFLPMEKNVRVTRITPLPICIMCENISSLNKPYIFPMTGHELRTCARVLLEVLVSNVCHSFYSVQMGGPSRLLGLKSKLLDKIEGFKGGIEEFVKHLKILFLECQERLKKDITVQQTSVIYGVTLDVLRTYLPDSIDDFKNFRNFQPT